MMGIKESRPWVGNKEMASVEGMKSRIKNTQYESLRWTGIKVCPNYILSFLSISLSLFQKVSFHLTFVKNINPFQIINAENTIIAKFNTWNNNWRLFPHSFLSSKTCLSIISLIILAFFYFLFYLFRFFRFCSVFIWLRSPYKNAATGWIGKVVVCSLSMVAAEKTQRFQTINAAISTCQKSWKMR